jgi:DNA-binding MarR family transcriptional regulator
VHHLALPPWRHDLVVGNPDADVTATELTSNILYAAELVWHRVDQILRQHTLTRGSFNLLAALREAGEPLTPSALSSRMQITTATLTGIIDTLERRGLVERRPNPRDRRSVLVSIGAAGSRSLEDAVSVLAPREKVWASVITALERGRLLPLLGALENHLRALGPEPTGRPR